MNTGRARFRPALTKAHGNIATLVPSEEPETAKTGGQLGFRSSPAANRRGQEVLLRTLGGTLRGVAYDGGPAVWWDVREHVRLDSAVQFGAPCLAGTRIPTAQLSALRAAGDTPEQIAALFARPRELVDEAIEFEAELARAA